MFGLVTREAHERALAAKQHTTDHLERLLATAQADRDAARAGAERARAERDTARTELAVAVAGREDALRQLAAVAVVESPVPEASAEHDAHRKALADALGAEPEASWAELIAEVGEQRQSAGMQAVLAATKARRTKPVDDDHRPVDGGSMAPRSLAAELLREREHSARLQKRLDEARAINEACTCAGGEQA